MRIDLQQLSTADAHITLPTESGPPGIIHVAETTALRGVLEQSPGTLRIADGMADAMRFVEAQLRFGKVQLRVDRGALLKRLKMQLNSESDALSVEAAAEHLKLDTLTVRAGTVVLTAEVMARGVSLELDHGLGWLRAAYVELSDLTLAIGTTTLHAPHLVAQDLVLGWGSDSGFQLAAATARAGDLTLTLSSTKVQASTLSCTALAYKNSRFTLGSAVVQQLDAVATLAPPAAAAPAHSEAEAGAERTPQKGAQPLFDLQLLDGLEGHVNVDLGVHMMLAVLPRHAVHRLRLDVEQGTINYRAVEDGLARLEDALLDFSLRDDRLVLELGIPFLHTRGHGKSLVSWALTPSDISLAEAERVRLSVLAQPIKNQPEDDDEGENEQKRGHGAFRVRGVDADEIDVKLALTPARTSSGSVIRTLGFSSFSAAGNVHVRPEGGDAQGHAELDIGALTLAFSALPLGNSALAVAALDVPGLVALKADFAGASPTEIHVQTSELLLRAFSLG